MRKTIEETMVSGLSEAGQTSPEGVELRTFVSRECGSTGFSTGTATFLTGAARLAYHMHDCSEAITILLGTARVIVDGRGYVLERLDCMHIPGGVSHCVQNTQGSKLIAHWTLASSDPQRTFVDPAMAYEERGFGYPEPGDPEHLNRYSQAITYELSERALFSDLFAKRFGAMGICGGYGRFMEGASLPCHTHSWDESITILSGTATCLVQGRSYSLSGLHTAFVPKGKPHRFLNSGVGEMEMLWVYGGDEPDRTLVDNQYCSGLMKWP